MHTGFWLRNSEENRRLARPRRRWECNTKEIELVGVEWGCLDNVRYKWRAVVDTALNILDLKIEGKS
jgi:hypothetical protein